MEMRKYKRPVIISMADESTFGAAMDIIHCLNPVSLTMYYLYLVITGNENVSMA